MVRWLTQASVVIGACVSTGLVALLASGPLPVHPPVWPPVGVALAALVVCRRLWPAVAVAAALLALVQLRRSADLPWPELLVGAVAVGLLYAAEAAIGAWLIRRAIGDPPRLVRAREVLAFLLVAGPLHTLIASAAGTALYCTLGVVAWPDWSGAWLRWWCGDAAGGLAFAPIALALVGQPRAAWRPRAATVGVPLALAAGLVVLAVVFARGRDEDHARQRVAAEADRAASVVAEDFARVVGKLEAVRDAYPADAFTRPAARGFIQHDLRAARLSAGAVTATGIDLMVPGDRREAFEKEVRRDARGPLVGFRLFERGPDGRPVPAAARDRHVVTYQVEPPARDPIGFDAASDPARADAYHRAAETGRPAVASSGVRTLLIVVPIPGRRGAAEVRGFVTASLGTDAWLAALPSGAGLQFALLPPEAAPADAAGIARPVPLAGESWQLAAVASPDYLAAHRTRAADWVAAGGLAALAVLALLLLRLTGQTAAAVEAATARELAEAARRESEARLAEAQKVAGVGYWEWDPVADQGYWSPELAAILGEPADREPTAADLLARVHPDDRPRFEEALRNRLADRSEAVVRVVRPDGETRWVAATLARAPGKLGPVVRGTARDVTEKKLFEENLQQTQRLESLGVLAGGVAHDFNNLLTGILGNTSLARELLPASSSLHEYLRPIEKSAEHAAQLCQQMLGYAGRGGPPRGAVDVNRLIEDAADLVRLSVSRKAALRSELAAGLPPVEADPGQLRQVLLNLVQNASEALGAKGGTITVRTGGASEPEASAREGHWSGEPPAGPYVWVEVADTGCGMDEPTLAKVFDPFFSTKFTGRGLGLAAVRGIVEAHRGAVRVTSAPGRGTAFRVYLPVASPRPPGVDEPTPWPLLAAAPDRAALVVDDEPAVRKLAAISLRSLGFAVAEAAAGPEAVELFRADPQRFALILLDLGLAGTDGRDVLVEVRKVRPDLPVVLTSGSPEPTGLPYGPMLQFLPKPFRPVDLKGCVRRVIGSTPGPGPR